MTSIIDDIRYLPWENKRPRKIRPLRHEPPPPLTIERLEPHHCRWPLGKFPYYFCGEAKVELHSYCVTHLKLAYKRGYADGHAGQD